MARINDIKQRLLSVGGTAADWNMMLSSGLGLSDLFWNNGEKEKDKSQDLARDMMVKGNFVEYQCYQSNGALQGKAIIQLKAWENFDEGILTADHVVASDPYYEWYGSHDLSGGQAVYHVCRSKHTQCRCRLPRGDRRVIVHMDRWRCVNPSVMLENGYSTTKALEILEKMVKDFQPRVPEPAAPPQTAQHGPPVGGDATGVDRALDQLGVARGVEAPEKGGRDPPVVGPAYDEVIFEEKPEPMEKVADKGWSWSGGEADDSLRLPTFTRAIPRDRPPPAPAGLSSCSEV
eukprot:Skav219901  [mRNA]  locus=scaffold841:268590:273317:+ [translate_table: standard]